MAMVVKANRHNPADGGDLGGHIGSFASLASLFGAGFNHFWHAESENHGGDCLFIQGHVSPGVYARAYMEGRLTEEQLLNFRQEVDGKGLSSYPHPKLMPNFWQFPTVSMGLGPLIGHLPGALPEIPACPWHCQHRKPQGLGVLRRRRDGRSGVAGRHRPGRTRKARQPDLRDQLQPAAPGRPGARQRQDHPGARRRIPRLRLERDQADLGQPVGSAAGRRQGRRAAQDHDGMQRRRLPGLQGQRRRLCAQAFLRPRSAHAGNGRPHDRRRNRRPAPWRSRFQEGLCRV